MYEKDTPIKNECISLTSISLVHYQKADRIWKYSHETTHYSIAFTMNGSCFATCNGNSYILKKGSVLFMQRGDIYTSEDRENPYEYILVEFDCDDDNTDFSFPQYHEAVSFDKTETLFKKIYEIYQTSDPLRDLKLKRILYDILISLSDETYKYKENYNYKRIKASVEFIDQNIFRRYIDVSELAEISGLSISHFNRVFKNVFGTTPTKYMNILRIERGKKLLNNSSLSVGQIAELSGFSGTYYFSKMFKQFTGVSPLKFRELIG